MISTHVYARDVNVGDVIVDAGEVVSVVPTKGWVWIDLTVRVGHRETTVRKWGKEKVRIELRDTDVRPVLDSNNR